jgi:uncharacterized small protein (TIGR04563 family)
MARIEKQKQSLYFPEDMLREIMRESVRIDRSLSWTVQQAWRLAREELRKLPAVAERSEAVQVPRYAAADGPPRRPSNQVLEFLRGKFDRELTG